MVQVPEGPLSLVPGLASPGRRTWPNEALFFPIWQANARNFRRVPVVYKVSVCSRRRKYPASLLKSPRSLPKGHPRPPCPPLSTKFQIPAVQTVPLVKNASLLNSCTVLLKSGAKVLSYSPVPYLIWVGEWHRLYCARNRAPSYPIRERERRPGA